MRGTTVRTRDRAALEVVLWLSGMMKCLSSGMVEMVELGCDESRGRREEEREVQGYAAIDRSPSLSCSPSYIPINNKGRSS